MHVSPSQCGPSSVELRAGSDDLLFVATYRATARPTRLMLALALDATREDPSIVRRR
jgi:hypothetical protein